MYTLLKVQKMLPVHLVVIFNCTYIYVTGFRKTDHIVTIDIARNTDLKY